MNWYVLTTAPSREIAAQRTLTHRGIDAWCPVEHVEQRQRGKHCDKEVMRTFPLLAGYVLARLPSPGIVTDILASMAHQPRPAVTGYLGSMGWPTPVPDAALEALREIDGRTILRHQQKITVTRGQVIRILDKPATITSVRGGRIKAVLEWFGSQREVEITAKMLMAS